MNIPLLGVMEVDYMTYLLMRRDAFIAKLNQTEEGRDYLEKAWLLEQTKPDREESRRRFGGGE